MTTEPDLPFRLGRPEHRGRVIGWRPGQALAAVAAVGVLVAGLGAGGLGVLVGVLGAIGLGTVAVVPVAGRGLDEWAPVAACFVVRRRRGALCAGAAVVDASDDAPAHLRWPDGTATSVAVLKERGLRALADEPREVGNAIAAWLRALGGPGAPVRTVSLLSVTGPGSGGPRDAPWADGGIEVTTLVAVSASEPVDVARELHANGIATAATLEGQDLDAVLAARVAPGIGTLLACDTVARWRVLEAPSSVHAALLVEEWPAGDVDEQVLAPLCVSRDRRIVAVHARVEELGRARNRVAADRTSAAADESISRSGGFLGSPRAALERVRDEERAMEMAQGHGAVRLTGVVAIDAADRLALEVAVARVVADAAAVGMRMRRCDGDHRRGLLASVPGWCVP